MADSAPTGRQCNKDSLSDLSGTRDGGRRGEHSPRTAAALGLSAPRRRSVLSRDCSSERTAFIKLPSLYLCSYHSRTCSRVRFMSCVITGDVDLILVLCCAALNKAVNHACLGTPPLLLLLITQHFSGVICYCITFGYKLWTFNSTQLKYKIIWFLSTVFFIFYHLWDIFCSLVNTARPPPL